MENILCVASTNINTGAFLYERIVSMVAAQKHSCNVQQPIGCHFVLTTIHLIDFTPGSCICEDLKENLNTVPVRGPIHSSESCSVAH